MSDIWDAVATGWEEQADFVDAHVRAVTEVLLDESGVGPGSAVLELACGPAGVGIAAAARVGDEGRVVVADAAANMVAIAERRTAGLSNVTTLRCDIAEVDAPDASFDAVVCRHGLMFAADPAAAVAEARRVLRPGGGYATATWATRTDNAWLGIVFDAFGAQFDMAFPPPGAPTPFRLDDLEGLSQVLAAGGLEDVRARRVPVPMHVTTLDAWWERVIALAGPLRLALDGMEPDVQEAIRARALDVASATAQRSDGGFRIPGAALVAAGVAPG